MIEGSRRHFKDAFRRHFTEPLSRKAAGQLFDKYQRNGLIDILWDEHSGKYVVTMVEARERKPSASGKPRALVNEGRSGGA
jgi:hypothetical protein